MLIDIIISSIHYLLETTHIIFLVYLYVYGVWVLLKLSVINFLKLFWLYFL